MTKHEPSEERMDDGVDGEAKQAASAYKDTDEDLVAKKMLFKPSPTEYVGDISKGSVVGMGQEPSGLAGPSSKDDIATSKDKIGKTKSGVSVPGAHPSSTKKKQEDVDTALKNQTRKPSSGASLPGAHAQPNGGVVESSNNASTMNESGNAAGQGSSVAAKRQARMDQKLKEAGPPSVATPKTNSTIKAPGVAVGNEPTNLAGLSSLVIREPEAESSLVGVSHESSAPPGKSLERLEATNESLAKKRQTRYDKKIAAESPAKSNVDNKTDCEPHYSSAKAMPPSLAGKRKASAERKVLGAVKSEKEDSAGVFDLESGGASNFSSKAMADEADTETLPATESMLIEATLVVENEDQNMPLPREKSDPKLLVVAEAVEEEPTICGIRRNRCCIVLLILLLVVSLAVGITCGTGSCSAKEQDEPTIVLVNRTESPSFSPTQSPTMAPTPFVIDDLPLYSLEALQNSTSPQSLAYGWVRNDPNLENYANDRLLQRFALATMYYATQGDNWIDNSGWLSYDRDECTWFTNLDDNLYPEHTGYPCSDNLNYLYLTPWENGLAGTIPPELGLLTMLEVLDLTKGFLQGPIPTTLSNLTNLRVFWCDNCQLTGTLPTYIGRYPKLVALGFWGNRLTGTLPFELGMLSNLENLALRSNRLSGTLPSELGLLSNLANLGLWSNRLSGTLPSELGLLSNLEKLPLQENRLEGSVPSELGLLPLLQDLSLEKNSKLNSTIPTELGMLSSLYELWFSENEMTGTIPSELGLLSKLGRLWINNNNFTGPIPTELGMLNNLEELHLADNMLTSSVPTELGNIEFLIDFDLSNNDLEGNVDKFLNFTSIQLESVLVFGNDMLSGTVPSDLCYLGDDLGFDCSVQLCGCNCSCSL